ncbi:MAG: hypothetical protein F4Z31_07640 [Gemmatimonadetes bacterium]|nr:hypothetical protein [Gemmatimonadota bacterium]
MVKRAAVVIVIAAAACLALLTLLVLLGVALDVAGYEPAARGAQRVYTHTPAAGWTAYSEPELTAAPMLDAPTPTAAPAPTATPAPESTLAEDCASWGGELSRGGTMCIYPGGRETSDHFRWGGKPDYPGHNEDDVVTVDQKDFATAFCQEMHQSPDIDKAHLGKSDGACQIQFEFDVAPEMRTRELCGVLGPAYKWVREFDRCETELPYPKGSVRVLVAPGSSGFNHHDRSKDPALVHYTRWWVWLEHA